MRGIECDDKRTAARCIGKHNVFAWRKQFTRIDCASVCATYVGVVAKRAINVRYKVFHCITIGRQGHLLFLFFVTGNAEK
jgi:hypothetical protein